MKYRHKKRGTEYEIISDMASFQTSAQSLSGQKYAHVYDDDSVVVYRSLDDGEVYVRRFTEFFDGRFEEVND